ncbi:hypothetical protein R0J90_24210, partial [Micrococcus sp. SIMBA_144]
TVMTTTAQTAQQQPSISRPDIYGVNIAFLVILVLTIVALVLSFFIKKNNPFEKTEETNKVPLKDNQDLPKPVNT